MGYEIHRWNENPDFEPSYLNCTRAPLPCSTRMTMRSLSIAAGVRRTASEIRSPVA